jgi:UDP-glucose 4-epimerase
MRILITGGCGFIGYHLVKFWQFPDVEVVILDIKLPPKKLKGLKYHFIWGSITDRNIVKRALIGVDYVFHLAAKISVPESMDYPYNYYNVNSLGTIIMLEESCIANVKHLVFASSSANYGTGLIVPKHENMLLEPRCPYAFTKIDGEYLCEMFRLEKKIKTTSLRFFNVYGEGQNPKAQYAAAIPKFITQCLNNETITLYGGEQTRDFIYVQDIVKGMVHVVINNIQGVYNLGTGKSISIKKLAYLIKYMTNSKSNINYLPPRAGDVMKGLACMNKFHKTGYTCDYNLYDGILNVIYYLKSQKSFPTDS